MPLTYCQFEFRPEKPRQMGNLMRPAIFRQAMEWLRVDISE
jgi:hypothetical protein